MAAKYIIDLTFTIHGFTTSLGQAWTMGCHSHRHCCHS